MSPSNKQWLLVLIVSVCASLGRATGQTAANAHLVPQFGLSRLTSAAFSPNGDFMITGGEGTSAQLWEMSTGRQIRAFKSSFPIRAVAFSPDGNYVLTAGDDHIAHLWDVRTGIQLRSFEGHGGNINAAAFSTDGSTILTGGEDWTVRTWDVSTGKQIHSFAGKSGNVLSVGISKNNQTMLMGGREKAVLWNLPTGKEIRVLQGHSFYMNSAAITTDGSRVLTGGDDKQAILWDVTTGRILHKFSGHTKDVSAVAFSPDNNLCVTASDDSVRLWNVSTGQQLLRLRHPDDLITAISFTPDGKTFVTASKEGSLTLWSRTSGKRLQVFHGETSPVEAVAFSPNNRALATAHWNNTARLWNLESGSQTVSFVGHSSLVSSLAFSPDSNMLITGSWDHTAKLWNVETGSAIRSLNGHTDFVNAVAFSSNGEFVLTGGLDKRSILWNVKSGKPIRAVGIHKLPVTSVSFSPDGRVALAEEVDATRSWDLLSGNEVAKFHDLGAGLSSTSFSHDGRAVIGADDYDNSVDIWDASTGKVLKRLTGHQNQVTSVAIATDDKQVLSGSWDLTARLWDIDTAKQVRSFEGHSDLVNSVALSPDGRFVVTGSNDTTTRVWDAKTGSELAKLISFDNGGWAVVTNDGRFDTNQLDGQAPLVWVVDDEPMRALPLEIFMRDYYTPGLLARVMNGERLPQVRSIAEIKDRVQPEVKVVRVTPSKTMMGRVDVVVHAASHTDGKGIESGLQDLRLFRDGQMVVGGYLQGPLKDGDFTFHDLMLKSDAPKVTFTAYAFNSERIKSATASLEYERTSPFVPNPARRHAYLVQIGVNHYAADSCELNFSVNDATRMSITLEERMSARGLAVEPALLTSEGGSDAMGAAKDAIRNKLAMIASRATPDDVFILSFSGHGYSAPDGQFYILPSDTKGSCHGVTGEMLKSAISADELTEWLRPIDAGEMTLVLDACHSAESVEANGFKPGPLGSRGLGQLAYDKRMRVLAASRANETAQEYASLKQGLLSYVLTQDGLAEGKADWKPVDGKITVGEWLGYASQAVPRFVLNAREDSTLKPAQIPALFDFSKTDTLVLQ